MNGWVKLALVALFGFMATSFAYTFSLSTIDQARGERLSSLEASVSAMRADLLRIDGKLERLLERRSPQGYPR